MRQILTIAIILTVIGSVVPSTPAASSVFSDLGDGLEEIESALRSGCARLLGSFTSRVRGFRFRQAIQAGKASALATVSTDQIWRLHDRINPLILSRTYNSTYLTSVLAEGDQLFAYDGRLLRWRESDHSVFLIPKDLEYYISLAMHFDIRAIRRSWLEANLYPFRPEFKTVEPWLTAELGQWSKLDETFYYTVLLAIANGGFLNLHVRIFPDHTLFWIKERTHRPTDSDYSRNREKFLADQMGSELADLFATNSSGEKVRKRSGQETLDYIEKIGKVRGLMFY